jgi:hypothetical protein
MLTISTTVLQSIVLKRIHLRQRKKAGIFLYRKMSVTCHIMIECGTTNFTTESCGRNR